MKKIYLSILGITAFFCSFSQIAIETRKWGSNEEVPNQQMQTTEYKKIKKNQKALGSSIFNSDFSNATDWTIATQGNASTGSGWNVNSTIEGRFNQTSFNTTSDGDFAELWNGEFGSSDIGVTHTLTTSNAIDITTNNLTLKFEQFGAMWFDAQEVYISTDNSTWIKVGDNSDRIRFTQTTGAAYDNPSIKKIVLASYISNSATSLWIRFSWTSLYTSELTDPTPWYTYGWMIDDVDVLTFADNDLLMLDNSLSTGQQKLIYSKVPLHQATNLHFKSNIINIGNDTLKDVSLSVAVTSGNTYSSIINTLSTMDTTLFETDNFSFTQMGIYNYTATANTAIDDNLSDNSKIGTFEITNSEFTVEDGTYSGNFTNTSTNVGFAIKVGNIMDIIEDSKIDSMYVYISNNTFNIGLEFRGQISKFNTTSEIYEPVAETNFTIISENMLGQNVKLPLNNIINVSAGDDLLVMASHEGGEEPVRFGLAQDIPDRNVLAFISTSNQPIYIRGMKALKVGIYLNQSASVTENNPLLNVSNIFPNPTYGETSVTYNLTNASKVTVNVMDITGKIIYSEKESNKTEGKHTLNINASAFNSGVYYVTIITDEAQVTKKLIKK